MSTVGPEALRELADRLPEVIDAPVLGSRSEAESGTLHVFVGGTDAQYARWSPLLSVLGKTHHVGPVGAGASAKLVANSTLVGTVAVLGEALKLADRLGLSREAAYEVLSLSPIAAQAERRRAAVEANDFPPRFALALAARTPTWSARQRPTCASRARREAGSPMPTAPAGANAITPRYSPGF
jgi:3-hydroxyisobutyrate dehydrogenase-like beta-hydroxyacid dehydrogenase